MVGDAEAKRGEQETSGSCGGTVDRAGGEEGVTAGGQIRCVVFISSCFCLQALTAFLPYVSFLLSSSTRHHLFDVPPTYSRRAVQP